MILNYNGEVYNFPEPKVETYLEDGIKVRFCDGRSIVCDDVSGDGGDTCVWWSNDRYGSMVGPTEGVFTRKDYIQYCKNKWKHSVECRLDRAKGVLEFFGVYKEITNDYIQSW